ncbi:uncharacterized protein CELE_C41G6.13 [Caenorhabditis elegans]|uniref:Secreted protein n=1 Tax=Caenorhabditis elegans TaxID=6239 RepID=G5EGT5_CAEEL|nr:Secreted protein [Caenorhabditis elegans]NP_506757.1 Secreted protein [Caenorhabditis elegans]CAA21763.1 Secreted protein [Caenorhabditis elegans]CAB02837.1 Secreted protein [Caenorhabditis elegans]|eukprot:NP_506754.1 Uncharacterized protein CELE_Y75B12B.8 [Caenorhabditis elegans]
MNVFLLISASSLFLLVDSVHGATEELYRTSAKPSELFHITDEKLHRTFAPGAFTFTYPPFNRNTFAPLKESVTKTPADEEAAHFTHRPPYRHATKGTNSHVTPKDNREVMFTWKILTWKPEDLAAVSKKPHTKGTKAPPLFGAEELAHQGKHTFPPGAFTYKFTIPPLGRRTFAPFKEVVTQKPHSKGTKAPTHDEKSSQDKLYDPITWKPIRITWKPVDDVVVVG